MKLSSIIATLSWAAVCLAFQQQWIFYTELGCTGDGLILRTKQPNFVPEAPRIVSTHKSLSFEGVWGLYSAVNYTTSIVTAINPGVGCWNNSYPTTKSIRYLGPPDTTTHSISLYEGTSATGQEFTITGPSSNNIPFEPKSIFCTGTTTWTFYTGNDFDGVATCFTPPNPPSLGWFTWLPTINSTLSNVRSILRGCNRHIDQYYFAVTEETDISVLS